MTVIAPAPIVMNAATVQLGTTGGNNFELTVSTVSLAPTTPTTTWTGVGGNTLAVAGTPTWKANLTYLQDPKTTTSLQNYLTTNAGTTQKLVFAPQAGTGNTAYTVNVIVVPGTIGGDVNALLSSSVSFDCVGQPVASTLS